MKNLIMVVVTVVWFSVVICGGVIDASSQQIASQSDKDFVAAFLEPPMAEQLFMLGDGYSLSKEEVPLKLCTRITTNYQGNKDSIINGEVQLAVVVSFGGICQMKMLSYSKYVADIGPSGMSGKDWTGFSITSDGKLLVQIHNVGYKGDGIVGIYLAKKYGIPASSKGKKEDQSFLPKRVSNVLKVPLRFSR